jgi:hypothetical protein
LPLGRANHRSTDDSPNDPEPSIVGFLRGRVNEAVSLALDRGDEPGSAPVVMSLVRKLRTWRSTGLLATAWSTPHKLSRICSRVTSRPALASNR